MILSRNRNHYLKGWQSLGSLGVCVTLQGRMVHYLDSKCFDGVSALRRLELVACRSQLSLRTASRRPACLPNGSHQQGTAANTWVTYLA